MDGLAGHVAHLDQGCTTHDGGENVVHIMHDAAGELPEHLDALGALQLFLEILLLADIAEIELQDGAFVPWHPADSDLDDGLGKPGMDQRSLNHAVATGGVFFQGLEQFFQGLDGNLLKKVSRQVLRHGHELACGFIREQDPAILLGEYYAIGGEGHSRLEAGPLVVELTKTVEPGDRLQPDAKFG